MPYAVIAAWDNQFRVSRYNYVEAEAEAIAIVDKLHGVGPDALPPVQQAPNAYYVLMPAAPAGTAGFQHRARFWVADPVNGTVSFDTAFCHEWQSKVTSRGIDTEADIRADKIFSPDNPSRAARVKSEMPDGAKKDALVTRVAALQTTAQTLKDSLVAMTPEQVLGVKPADDARWPE